jgi:hypothetical protein
MPTHQPTHQPAQNDRKSALPGIFEEVVMTHMYQFDTEGQAVVFPRGPRPAPAGPSDSVRALNARLDKMLASLPKSVAHKASAPTTTSDQGDEIDGAAIFAARQRDIEAARTSTGTPAPEADADPFSPGAAAAIFQARK